MIDYEVTAVVRRLLSEVRDEDRGLLTIWVVKFAEYQFPTLGEAAYELGSLTGAELVAPLEDSAGQTQLLVLHKMLLTRTQQLGSPVVLRSPTAHLFEHSEFEQSRRFLLALDDENLWNPLRIGVLLELRRSLYRSSDLSWLRLKNNIRNAVERSPNLTMVVVGRRRYIAHSKFATSAVSTQQIGCISPPELLEQFTDQSPFDVHSFIHHVASCLDQGRLILIDLEELTSNRLDYLKSCAKANASWAYPRG